MNVPTCFKNKIKINFFLLTHHLIIQRPLNSKSAMNIKRIDLRAVMQRVPGAMLISSYLLLLFGAAHVPFVYCFYLLVLHVVFLANNFRYGFAIYAFYRDSVLHSKTDWISLYKLKTNTCSTSDTLHDLPFASVLHVIVIPNYNEHFHTLCETLDVLASHHLAISQYRICLAMELNEPGSLKKALQLESIYSDLFFDITHTMHPNDIPNEIRGKSSNVNWAVRQMAARGSTERHGHQIVTVMDADTTFAQDYFTSVTYHFSTASIADRKIMMFCGGIIFDRNADDVPALVRVFDLGWAVGIMSNLYQSSSIKVPCSSYSISMDLCIHVDFWDTTAEAMGEDCHMYLKCFYSTQGRVIVKTIFSPVSVLNVQVSEKGFIGQFKGIYARYVQALRHLWASLDTGYMLRRSLLSLIAPQYDLKINGVSQQSLRSCSTKDEMLRGISFYKLFSAFHRIMEAHTYLFFNLGGCVKYWFSLYFPILLFLLLATAISGL